MKVLFASYTKKELIAMIERDMQEDHVAILSTSMIKMESLSKKKITNLTFEFPHEMIQEPGNVLHFLRGNITTSIILLKNPQVQLSKEYQEGLNANDGVFGFTIDK